MIQILRVFFLGMCEFRSSFTYRHETRRLRDCYDAGREWAHRLTFGRFEK